MATGAAGAGPIPLGSIRTAGGAVLVTAPDTTPDDPATWRVCTTRRPTDAGSAGPRPRVAAVRGVTSNAIVLVRDGMLIGIGSGQTSRVDAARQAVEKAARSAARQRCGARPARRTRSTRSPTASTSASRRGRHRVRPAGRLDARRGRHRGRRGRRCGDARHRRCATSATDEGIKGARMYVRLVRFSFGPGKQAEAQALADDLAPKSRGPGGLRRGDGVRRPRGRPVRAVRVLGLGGGRERRRRGHQAAARSAPSRATSRARSTPACSTSSRRRPRVLYQPLTHGRLGRLARGHDPWRCDRVVLRPDPVRIARGRGLDVLPGVDGGPRLGVPPDAGATTEQAIGRAARLTVHRRVRHHRVVERHRSSMAMPGRPRGERA